MAQALRAMRFMYGYPLRHWRRMAIPQVLMFVAQVLAIGIPIVMRKAIDVGVLNHDTGLLLGSAGVVLGIGAVSVALKHIGKQVKFRVASQTVTELRHDLLAQLLRLEPGTVEEASGGRALSRLTADATGMRGVVNGGLFELVNQLLLATTYLAFCLYFDWRVALIAAAPLLPSALGTLSVQYKLRTLFADIRSRFASLMSNVAESLANIHVIKTFGREQAETDRLGSLNRGLADQQRHLRMIYSLWNAALRVIASLPTPLALLFGGREVYDGRLSVGSLVALVALVMMFEMSVHMVTMDANGVFHTIVIGKRLLQVMDAAPALDANSHAVAAPPLSGRIVLDDVTLARGDSTVLEHVRLTVEPGEFTVLLGPTGGGKSLLLHTIARLRDPDGGTVLLDGVDARSYEPTSIRRQILCLPQRQWIFEGTLADNIRLARPDADDQAVRAAADSAGLASLDLDRRVAAGAPDLSAGERQRVGLARAVLADPAVLLLDNPTANLDAETEARLIDTIVTLQRGRTLIVAGQQSAFLRHADRAWVVDGDVHPVDHQGEITDAFLERLLQLAPISAAEGSSHDD